jgi:hypothetical protein
MVAGEALQFRFCPMKHRPRIPEQDDLLRPRLVCVFHGMMGTHSS